ncbi:MAG: type I methionyl aminopeptidase [Chloroflexota bacterium]|jgi:methionyl aminopeptidase|nr:type I methionyl aminopeptidase [Chloroflexota bacterium]
MIVLKSLPELALMRQAGHIVATVLAEIGHHVKPGVTTLDLDQIAADIIAKHGAVSSFKGYIPDKTAGQPPFPGTICASVNDEIVHGIPTTRRLKEGDIVKIDVGACYKGYHADSATTFPVGRVNRYAQELMSTTQECLKSAIAVMRKGNRFGDIGAAIQRVAHGRGYSVVEEYSSHGVGRKLHEGFSLMNTGEEDHGFMLRPGLTIAVEPMINQGVAGTKVKKDLWTVATKDGKLSAHFEHTVAITDGEPEVLTILS